MCRTFVLMVWVIKETVTNMGISVRKLDLKAPLCRDRFTISVTVNETQEDKGKGCRDMEENEMKTQ